MTYFIGREKEIRILEQVLAEERSRFVAVYGRRRVGKTMLIQRVFDKHMTFHLTGIANVTTEQQLVNFQVAFERQAPLTMGLLPDLMLFSLCVVRRLHGCSINSFTTEAACTIASPHAYVSNPSRCEKPNNSYYGKMPRLTVTKLFNILWLSVAFLFTLIPSMPNSAPCKISKSIAFLKTVFCVPNLTTFFNRFS